MILQSPKKINSETFNAKSVERKFKKIKINPNFFTNRLKRENVNLNNKKKLPSLDLENLFIYNRINNITSIYQTKNFEKDYELSKTYRTNLCKLPKINFKKYKKPLKLRETPKKLFKLNLDNFNTVQTNLTLTSKNHFRYLYDHLDDADYISLNFFLNQKSEGHPYIIMASPDEYFYKVIKKLCNTIPYINKKYVSSYILENGEMKEIQNKKTVRENGLTENSKIYINYE